jgi:hypothetical protein
MHRTATSQRHATGCPADTAAAAALTAPTRAARSRSPHTRACALLRRTRSVRRRRAAGRVHAPVGCCVRTGSTLARSASERTRFVTRSLSAALQHASISRRGRTQHHKAPGGGRTQRRDTVGPRHGPPLVVGVGIRVGAKVGLGRGRRGLRLGRRSRGRGCGRLAAWLGSGSGTRGRLLGWRGSGWNRLCSTGVNGIDNQDGARHSPGGATSFFSGGLRSRSCTWVRCQSVPGGARRRPHAPRR